MSKTATSPTTSNAEDVPILTRIAENPRPALRWTIGALILFAIEFGAFATTIVKTILGFVRLIPGSPGVDVLMSTNRLMASIPTLLSRRVIPNQGYWDGHAWVHTFFGWAPAYSWVARVVVVYIYAFFVFGWIWVGYRSYREHYREADWVPRDDMMERFRSNRWGQFGLVVVFLFIVLAVFAPALGPYTLQGNIVNPYENQIKYYDDATNSVQTTTMGTTELSAVSKGSPTQNVGPWSYDEYDQFHPFGTLTSGKDLFTFIAAGSRVSFSIAITSLLIAGGIAIVFGMMTAYYKGALDLAVVVSSDTLQSLPFLLVAILALGVFKGTWFGSLYDGGVMLIALFSVFYWPGLWRTIRGPAFQISEAEWIDAAKSYGQVPRVTMRKHMFPYVASYIIIYGSLVLGGIILSIAGLSFLGLGISSPTPEWGRAVSSGQPYVSSASWHISLIPGILITLVVIGFNALGDGLRDAIDPETGGEEPGAEDAIASGGGA